MKKLIIAALAMVTVAATCVAQEESSPLSFDATLDLYSAYVWRGMVLNDEPVAQPGASVGFDLGDYGSISAGVWANYDFNNFAAGDGRADGFSELDYTLSYGIDLGDFSVEVGHIWYSFPVISEDEYDVATEEIYVSVAYNNDIVTPSLAVYHDYSSDDDVEGTYASFGLAKDFEISEQVGAGVFASVGAGDDDFNESYFGPSDDAVLDGNLGAYVSYALTDNLSVGATIVYSSLIDSDIRDAGAYKEEEMLWGGINLAASF